MKITKEDLDKKINEHEGGGNTQTYREYIKETEKEFGIEPVELEKLSDTDLNDYLKYLDWMWEI